MARRASNSSPRCVHTRVINQEPDSSVVAHSFGCTPGPVLGQRGRTDMIDQAGCAAGTALPHPYNDAHDTPSASQYPQLPECRSPRRSRPTGRTWTTLPAAGCPASMASAPPPHPTSAPGREQPQRTQPACSFVASALPLHPTSALGRERMIRRHAVCDGCRFNIYAGAGPCMRASAGPQLAAAWHDAGGLLAYMDFQSAVESLDSGAAAVSTPSGSGC